jgi:hypothetical protein
VSDFLIPDEVVEAAAKAIWLAKDLGEWDGIHEKSKERQRTQARESLTAGLSAWGAKTERTYCLTQGSSLRYSNEGSNADDRPWETRVVTPWVLSKGEKHGD